MHRRHFSLLAALAPMVLVLTGSSCDHSNGCEEALSQTKTQTIAVCAEVPYASTPFCKVCVDAGYLSTTGPMDCRCKLLAYDQASCTNPSDDDAKAAIRGAIVWANDSCSTFSIERGDGGTDDGSPSDAGD